MSAGGLVERLRAHAVAARLFVRPGRALVAVSGGGDSLALLYLLHRLAENLRIELTVGHVNHGIHAQSGGWAHLTETSAAALRLPFVERVLALGSEATETVARRARYAALRALQEECGARYLVTAHHADDQVETVLFRLLRGAGPAGIAGIPVRGPRGLRRPLLVFTRDEVRGWLCAEHPDVRPVEDSANDDPAHERVWLRSTVLPFLRARMPDVDRALLHSSVLAMGERRAWEAMLRTDTALDLRTEDETFEVERAPFLRYDNALSVALLRALCRIAGCHLSSRRAKAVARFAAHASSGRRLDLGGGWTAEAAFGRLRILPPPAEERSAAATPAVVTWGQGEVGAVRWGQWRLRWRREVAGRVRRSGWTTWIRGGGEARAYRTGDVIRPLGGVGRRPVRRLLMEARVPTSKRRGYPLVVRENEVVWIPGVCRSDVELPRPGEWAVRLEVRRSREPAGRRRSNRR
jgi:tRNA(Ile)-lysidine synthase